MDPDLVAKCRKLEEQLSFNSQHQQNLDQLLVKLSSLKFDSTSERLFSKRVLAEKSAILLRQAAEGRASAKDLWAPYFKDEKGFAPSKSKDEINMEKMGFFNYNSMATSSKWQHWEMKLLDETVRKVALGVLRRPLVSKKAALLDQLKTEQNANLATALTELKLDEIDKEMEKLSGAALFEVLNDVNTEHDWERISATEFDGMRSPLELRAMWRQCLILTLERKPWSKDENEKLREIAINHNFSNWNAISDDMGGRRSAYQCFLQYQSLLNKQRDGWSPEEDKKLKTVMKSIGGGKNIPWDKVAEQMPGRNITELEMRWSQQLDPRIVKTRGFTEKDDMILCAARSRKMTFRQIAQLLPGRTESQLRIRYIRLESFKPGVPWIPEDDQKLLALVEQFGKKKKDMWRSIETYFPDRDKQQLKGRHKRLLNDAAGIKTTLPRKGKKSKWSLNKRRTAPIFKAKDVLKFANKTLKSGRMGRKGAKKSPLDLEFEQIFRSHYAQPKGRKRHYHPNVADPDSVVHGQRLSELLKVHFNWRAEKHLEAAAATDSEFNDVLNVYRQMKMMHCEDGWQPEGPSLSQLMPPNIGTLVGLRTLLLEERNVLAMTLQDRQETPTYLKGVIARADQFLNPPDLDEPALESGVRQMQLPETRPISPQLAFCLFKQRFLSLFLWPSFLSQFGPSLAYKEDLFEGEERMACASSDEDEALGGLTLDFNTEDEEDEQEDDAKTSKEVERKELLREKWLQYREARLNEPNVEEERHEVSAILRKKRRLPKKRGRKKLDMENWLQNQIRNNVDSRM